MKKLLFLTAAALLLAACQVPFGGSGSLKINLGASRTAAWTQTIEAGDLVRIQLVRNGVVVPLSGADYLEVTYAGQNVTVDDLSVGSGYSILVSAGVLDNGFFRIKQFGQSSEFEISAGADTAVSVATALSNLTLLDGTAGYQGAATVVGGNLVYLAGDSINSLVPPTTSTTTASTVTANVASALGSATIKSFSMGLANVTGTATWAEQLWINTDRGLSYLTGATLSTPEISHGSDPATYTEVDLSGTFQFQNSDQSKTYYLHLYTGPGSSAGGRVEETDGTTATLESAWTSIEDKMEDVPQEFKDMITESGDLFKGFARTDQFAFVSTAVGTYRVSKQMIIDGDSKSLQYFDPDFPLSDPLDENHYKLEVVLNDDDATPLSVATATTGSSAYVFIGSTNGLFAAPVNSTSGRLTGGEAYSYDAEYTATDSNGDALLDSNGKTLRQTAEDVSDYKAVPVAGTEGLNINTVVSTAAGGAIYTAAYASDAEELILLKDTAVIDTIPVFAGLPSGTLSLVWFKDGTTLRLVISGDDGTVTYDIANAIPAS